MDYSLMLVALSYFAGVYVAVHFNKSPVLCTAIAVGIPFIVSLATSAIMNSGYGEVLFNNVTLAPFVLTFIVQFFSNLFIFRKIKDTDSYAATIGWSVGGLLFTMIVIPFLVGKLFGIN